MKSSSTNQYGTRRIPLNTEVEGKYRNPLNIDSELGYYKLTHKRGMKKPINRTSDWGSYFFNREVLASRLYQCEQMIKKMEGK